MFPDFGGGGFYSQELNSISSSQLTFHILRLLLREIFKHPPLSSSPCLPSAAAAPPYCNRRSSVVQPPSLPCASHLISIVQPLTLHCATAALRCKPLQSPPLLCAKYPPSSPAVQQSNCISDMQQGSRRQSCAIEPSPAVASTLSNRATAGR